ncbi:unnamed protein product (macronuclear) [Paramecium tetraurelia]|uniref:Transmembrane protein n=1 Tax=Paramecium tetraurelia TaxID=5888 RepID=A0CAZ0_PARTE|nr:uncharacterized protein GSPATT00036740001 [Paramecium tetraurelia]CAK67957.1 unnamed protein product [Paramecium tetraurelia]|eukprot:XP_001435354.1 hypothetical protein (macronuclear) [Paramecium tetraurelia strain d4-2]
MYLQDLSCVLHIRQGLRQSLCIWQKLATKTLQIRDKITHQRFRMISALNRLQGAVVVKDKRMNGYKMYQSFHQMPQQRIHNHKQYTCLLIQNSLGFHFIFTSILAEVLMSISTIQISLSLFFCNFLTIIIIVHISLCLLVIHYENNMNSCGSNIHVHVCLYITLKPLIFVMNVLLNFCRYEFLFLCYYVHECNIQIFFVNINITFYKRRSRRQIINKPQINLQIVFFKQSQQTYYIYIFGFRQNPSSQASSNIHRVGQGVGIINKQLKGSINKRVKLVITGRYFSQLMLELLSKVEQEVMNVEKFYVRHQLMKILIQFNHHYIMHKKQFQQISQKQKLQNHKLIFIYCLPIYIFIQLVYSLLFEHYLLEITTPKFNTEY